MRYRAIFKKCKHIFIAALITAGSFILIFMILEIAVRTFAPNYIWQFRDAIEDWQLDAELGWIQKPNIDIAFITEQNSPSRFQTNHDGLMPCNTKRAKKEGIKRIMIFGDSIVVGRAVPQDKTINKYLELLLYDRGLPAEVINAGVAGYSTDQVLLRVRQLAPVYKPDIIVYGLCQNDYEGNILKEMNRMSKPVFIIEDNGRLAEVPPEINKSSKMHEFSNGPFHWFQLSALYRFLRPRLKTVVYELMPCNQENLASARLEIYYHPAKLKDIDWKIFTRLLVEMKKCAEENGARFLFYAHPSVEETWGPYIFNIERRFNLKEGEYNRYVLEDNLRKVAGENDISFCPVIGYFVKNQSRGPFHLLPRDPHCNTAGYELTAEAIADFLIKSGLIYKNGR